MWSHHRSPVTASPTKPTATGWDVPRIANAWIVLMRIASATRAGRPGRRLGSARDQLRPSRRWVDRWMPNLIHYNILDWGDHFAAWEQPALHTKEIRDTCFAKMRRTRV